MANYRIKVTQVLRVEKSTVLDVEADSIDDAIEAVSNGEVDLPTASDDVNSVWSLDHSSIMNEVYEPSEA